MVIEDKGALRGFSIELWTSISARLDRETEYLVMPDVGELLDAVGDGRADLGISAVSITSERESRFDFSQPILNAGLQILVRGAAGNAERSRAEISPACKRITAVISAICHEYRSHTVGSRNKISLPGGRRLSLIFHRCNAGHSKTSCEGTLATGISDALSPARIRNAMRPACCPIAFD